MTKGTFNSGDIFFGVLVLSTTKQLWLATATTQPSPCLHNWPLRLLTHQPPPSLRQSKTQPEVLAQVLVTQGGSVLFFFFACLLGGKCC